MVLYADILFLVDLSMDLLTLYLCGRLSHRPMGKGRLVLASVLGAAGSVLLVVFSAGRAVTFVCGVLLSALMTFTVFGRLGTVRAFVRQCLLVWGSGAITGGLLGMVLSLGEPVYLENGRTGQAQFPPLFLGTAILVYLLVRLLQKRMAVRETEVVIRYGGVESQVQVLVDTGNLLTDPLTGRAVILVSRAAALPLHLPLDADGRLPVLPVPAKGVSGTRLLWAVRPEKLTVGGIPRDGLVAAEEVPADHYGGYGGTCPASLV